MAVLETINNVVIGIVSVAFAFQVIYLFLFFLKPEQYPKAKVKHKFAVLVCAHNEGEVIGATVRNLMLQKYPRELYRIFVVADNCTDETASIAQQAGATVYIRQESDPKKQGKSFALKFGLNRMLEDFPDAESVILFDADNFPLPDYIDKMNDAFDSGATLARGYNHATNLTQNVVAGVSGLWYIRDCRFNCHARSALRIGEMLVGGGMMFSVSVICEDGGWKAMGYSEDAEFTCNQLFKKRKAHYVSEAVVYEDQPSTVGQLFKRNMRMGRGLLRLFFTHGIKCLALFPVTFKYTFLDMFLTLLFIPIAGLCCFWFPAYYIILFGQFLEPLDHARFVWEITNLVIILVCAFLIPFIAQAFLVFFLDRKKIGTPLRKTLPAIISFPLFMIIYALGITAGFLFRAKWKSIERSKFYDKSFVEKLESETGVPFDYILGKNPEKKDFAPYKPSFVCDFKPVLNAETKIRTDFAPFEGSFPLSAYPEATTCVSQAESEAAASLDDDD